MSASHSHLSQNSKKKIRAERRRRRAALQLLAVAVLLAGAVYLTGLVITHSAGIYPGVSVSGVPLGGLSEEEAEQLLLADWEPANRTACEVNIIDTVMITADPLDAGVYPDAESAARIAYEYGRDRGPVQNLMSWLRCRVRETELGDLTQSIDDDYFKALTEECRQALNIALGTEPYTIDYENSALVFRKGQGSLKLEEAELREALQTALISHAEALRFDGVYSTETMPDFEALHDELCLEPADAVWTDDGSKSITPETVGIEFDPFAAEAMWLAAGTAEAVSIPLKVTEPQVTKAELEALLFHDLLGATTTKYNNSPENRCNNVRLAASLIDGVILYPGEEFSFNEVVGARTEEAGFVPAPAFAGYDDIKDEIGGGVCQVSTTLYASALFSFLDITAHTCHIYPPNYIQLGMDTTVTIPEGGGRSIDFKFVNSKKAPIKIVAYTEETVRDNGYPFKTITVEIWGTLEPDDFMPVEFDNSYAGVYDYDRHIEPAYEGREGYTIKFTHDETEFEDNTGKGLRTLTHRKVIDSNGAIIQDRIINRTYSAGYALDTYYYRG